MGHGLRISKVGIVTAAVIAAGLVAAVPASAVPAGARAPGVRATGPHALPQSFSKVKTLDDRHDLTYNVLSDVNKYGIITGWYGDGLRGHPQKGYIIRPPYRQSDYKAENFPGSAKTEVLGLNDKGMIVGAYSKSARVNNGWLGFWEYHGKFHKVVYPTHNNSTPPQNYLSGINNDGIAVGDYVDSSGNDHAYRYNIHTHQFSLPITGAASVWTSAINNKGEIVGFFKRKKGAWFSYTTLNGNLTKLSVPGAGRTEAQGVNNNGIVVGEYVKSGRLRGFIWHAGTFHLYYWYQGKGMGIDGINEAGKVVGWYIDKSGNVHGFVAIP